MERHHRVEIKKVLIFLKIFLAIIFAYMFTCKANYFFSKLQKKRLKKESNSCIKRYKR